MLGLSASINNIFRTIDEATKQEYEKAEVKIDYNSDSLEKQYDKLGDQKKVDFLEIGKEVYLNIILNKFIRYP